MNSLTQLFPYLRPYRWHIFGSAALAIPLAILRVSPAKLIGHLIDDLLVSQDRAKLTTLPLILVGIFLLNFIVRFFHYYLMRVVVARVNQNIKNDLYRHLLGLSADYYTQQTTGGLIARVTSDTQYIDGGLSALATLLREPITFLGCFIYATYLNWKLTLVMIVIFPPLAWVFRVTGKNLKRYISKITQENALLFATLQETFTGIRMVKTFNLESYVNLRFTKQSNNFTKFLLKTAILEETSHPMVELLTSLALAAVVFYGGSQVLDQQMTAGDLMAFFTAFALMMNPLRLLNDVSIKLHSSSAAAERIVEVFNWKNNVGEKISLQPLVESGKFQKVKDHIESFRFEDVHFSYPDSPDRTILNGVTFELTKGKTLAIVGNSGAGKSSLISLIPRIFDPTSGKIFLDHQNIKDIEIQQLRNQIAIVSQDVFLFNDTIENNIRCGKLDARFEDILEASKRAHAYQFIQSLPDGFKTIIGDRGQKLSGGERQRLAIARAFLREAPLLILDEATSSLDSNSEKIVQTALNDLMLNRTTIIIAHRLSTIQSADEILFLKNGKIIERGSHQELLQLKGEYYKLYQVYSATND